MLGKKRNISALFTPAATRDRAFERLYRGHVHDVYRYVLAVMRNQADAEDATQATFLSAYRAFIDGEKPQKPRNWLLKIAHNECRQRFRASARRPKLVELDDRAAAPPLDETIPTADEIRSALGALSFNQRSAVVMRELEGRTYAEIGQILDVSDSAVETLLFRARRALREQLEGALTCGEAEASLIRRIDGRLSGPEQGALRAHLRECAECSALERKQRARRAAIKRLGAVQLPPSLTGFLGGGGSVAGGAAVGSGVAAKAAAVVAAGVVAGGVGHEVVGGSAASQPARTPQARVQQHSAHASGGVKPTRRAQATKAARTTKTKKAVAPRASTKRKRDRGQAAPTVIPAPAKSEAGSPTTGTAPPAPGPAVQPAAAPQPAQTVADTAQKVANGLPIPTPPTVTIPPPPPLPVELPTVPIPPPLPPPPALPPLPPPPLPKIGE